MKKIFVVLFFAAALYGFGACRSAGAGLASGGQPQPIGSGIIVESLPLNQVDDMNVWAQNEYLELLVNEQTSEFAIIEKSNGFVWCSTPLDLYTDINVSEEQKRQIRSLVKLTFSNIQTEETIMYSFTESVLKGQFEILKEDNGIRIDMVLGTLSERALIPPALPEERFMWILAQMEGNDRAVRRINALYRKYELDDSLSDATRREYINQYPILEEMNIYVVRTLNERESREIEGYMHEAGYTFEMYDEDLLITEYELRERISPYFLLSLEVKLDGRELIVSMPVDKIIYDKDNFYINSIEILRFFGAGHADAGGYVFLPDGSGSLLMFNSGNVKNETTMSGNLYGNDAALSILREAPIRHNMTLPVYGIATEGRAIFAVIEEGDPMASLIARLNTSLNSYNTAYASVTINAKDEFNIDEFSFQGGWSIHDQNPFNGTIHIRYFFLYGDKANYSGMAEAYRNYLVDSGVLTKKENFPELYINYLGAADDTERFLFIPYQKMFPLTTFDDVLDLTGRLKENGAGSIMVRMTGWMNNGMYHTASTGVNIEKSIGGKNGFTNMANTLDDWGVELYPSVNLMGTYNRTMFDGYNVRSHSPQMLDRRLAGIISYDMATSMFQRSWGFMYLIAPNKLLDMYSMFDRDYSALGVDKIYEVTLGRYLYSDFNKKNNLNRSQSFEYVTGLLKTISSSYDLAIEYGNGYALPYASHVLDVPMGHSRFFASDMPVPFLQMVIRGYLPYAGVSLNMADDYETSILKSVEYGSALQYTLALGNLDKLSGNYYSVGADAWMGKIINDINKLREVWDKTEGRAMISHNMMLAGVFETVYEGEIRVYTNYNHEAVNVNGATVPARSFIIV